MRGPSESKRRYWEREKSRFVSWMHKEGYIDEWNSLRWISQEDIDVCSDDKMGRYACVSRRNAPYSGGWFISVPGHYRVELKIIKGIDREVGFLSEKCADGFPNDRRNWLKKRFRLDMRERYDEARKALEAPWTEWLDHKFEREWDEAKKESNLRFHKFDYASQQLFQSITMAGNFTGGKNE